MAHFARLNKANIVEHVSVIRNEDILDEHDNESEDVGIAYCQSLYGAETIWRQTSYNATFRKNYAGIGFYYDENLDAFIPPQPYPSWELNPVSCQWEPPTPMPDNGFYTWDEESSAWKPFVN